MPYLIRNEAGAVVGEAKWPSESTEQTPVGDDHPELVAWRAKMAAPKPRTATAKQLRYALNAMGKRADWDAALASVSADTRDYWVVEPDPPESSSKLKRIATAAGVSLKDLYDAAVLA